MAEPVHTYTANYPPGTHWALDEAWGILDTIEPGVIPHELRVFLAGCIAGTLMRVLDERREDPDHA